MTFQVRRYRFSSFCAFFFSLSAAPSFAEQEMSQAATASSSIITVGLGLFSLLALYVFYLTFRALIKAYKEASDARKEAAAHASHDEKPAGQRTLSLAGWFFAFFALVTAVSLMVGYFGIAAGADISFMKAASAFIITLGSIAFGGVILYLFVLLLAFTWKAFRGDAGEMHGSLEAVGGGVPLNPEMTRRSFLSLLGWAWVAFTAATMGALSTMLRFAFPNVTFEPPLKFAAGFPNTYSIGVDERFKDGHRVWIVRNEKGFYALSTICTHLGCTPNWLQAEQKFKCPCHGSGYYPSGINFEGPAPRPLERFQITLGDDGQIVVDESVKFQQELGQWGLPGSFLEMKA
jgi:cytochrome b6-f complex iron-sulfur subunit